MEKLKKILKAEFINGRSTFDWIYLLIGLAVQVFAIWYGYHTGNPDSIIAIISGLTGIVSVVLCAQGKISFYIFGYIQLFTYVFGIAIPCALWGECIENVFYFVTMVYGTYIWFKNYGITKTGSTEVKSKKMDVKQWILSIAALLCFTIVFAIFLDKAHIWLPSIFPIADPKPFLDSFTTISPAVAQILLMYGYREQWAFWAIEDISSIILFIQLGSWVMVAQYLFWTINCIYGWYMWTKSTKKEYI